MHELLFILFFVIIAPHRFTQPLNLFNDICACVSNYMDWHYTGVVRYLCDFLDILRADALLASLLSIDSSFSHQAAKFRLGLIRSSRKRLTSVGTVHSQERSKK